MLSVRPVIWSVLCRPPGFLWVVPLPRHRTYLACAVNHADHALAAWRRR
jgi:hypothetical protein